MAGWLYTMEGRWNGGYGLFKGQPKQLLGTTEENYGNLSKYVTFGPRVEPQTSNIWSRVLII
jgi:hypothetical protein